MDALSDILRLVGLTGGVFLEAEFSAPWAVAGKVAPEVCRPFMAPPQQVVGFHYVIEGGFELAIAGAPPCRVGPGEALMLPRNDLHVLGSSASLPPIMIRDLMQPPNLNGVASLRYGGGGERTRLICGFMGGNDQLRLLLAALPPILKMDVAGLPGGEWITSTFSYAARTTSDGEPGAATVLAKVSEVLFVESIRRYLASLPSEESGWLAGLRDPVIGRALSLLHGRVEQDWTAEALAREVHMSRSAFADRFTSVVGQPPMRYLTRWRMQVACQKLLETHRPISQIAFEVGYDSEAAFTRAFRRELGAPPAAWRRQTVAQDGDIGREA